MEIETSYIVSIVTDLEDKYISSLKTINLDGNPIKEEDLNIDVLATHLIDLPYKIYAKNLQMITLLDSTSKLNKLKSFIEDNVSKEVNKMDELKNQSQRDAELRNRLLDSKDYLIIEKGLLTATELKQMLQSQVGYYEGLLSGIKYRYKQMCSVLLSDKKLQEAIGE
jgi:hypothetical protein